MSGYFRLRRKQVIVNTKDGATFKGMLWHKAGPLVVLKDAFALSNEGKATRLDGELVVERSNVSYYQVIG